MNEMVKSRWSAMDGCLVFDITINRAPHDGVPSFASVSCASGESESQRVTITQKSPSQRFEFKFRSGCYVSGYLQQKTPVHIDGIANTAIFADIYYGMKSLADEHHFEGIMVACPMRGPIPPPGPFPPHPTPIEPDIPIDPVEPLPIIVSHPEELFPYVYVRRWPSITAADLLYGFIQYTGASPPSSSFFENLVAARNQSREAAQNLALQFIDGDVLYRGDFIGKMDWIAGPVGQFAGQWAQLPKQDDKPHEWLVKAHTNLTRLLERDHLTWAYFESGEYVQTLDRVWQSYFALVIVLGYDTALLDALTITLRMAHVIAAALLPNSQRLAAASAAAAPELPAPTEVSVAQIAALCKATVVLPVLVFPLPPAHATGSSPPLAPVGWIEPYAIGDLQMVRQRLLRYQSGEIARIENVMRGERREVTHKRTHRQRDEHKQTTAEMQILQNDAADERSNLQEESRKTVVEASETNQYNKFTSSYGPPTQATLDGSWSKAVQQGANPGLDDTTRFARDILNKTVNRITRSVSQTRSSSTMSQTEDAVVSVIDNTAGTHSMRAVFRWLNKVYEACVVNYGQRLMMECMVCKPAAGFIAQERALAGQDFIKPLPPLHLGVATFEDIRVSGPRNYAQLGAYYGVLDLEPPPLAQRYASGTLRNGEEKQIAIPAGYGATHAFVSYVSTPSGLPAPTVLVGQQAVTPGVTPSPAPLNGEDDTVPVSVMNYQPGLSPPSDNQVQVNVELSCAPTQRYMDQWRIRTYASIMRAYHERLAAYLARAEGGVQARTPTRSPLANRQIEQRELKNACLRLLLERVLTLTGMATNVAGQSPLSEFSVDEPRYLQFFDEVLEWNEMVYSFYASPGLGTAGPALELGSLAADDDALFASFLQAAQARVLLPVQPAHVMAFLYFYSAGMLWTAPDQIAPVNPGDLALANDLKHAGLGPHPVRRVGPGWQVVVPTAMQVLDESDTNTGPCTFTLGSALP